MGKYMEDCRIVTNWPAPEVRQKAMRSHLNEKYSLCEKDSVMQYMA